MLPAALAFWALIGTLLLTVVLWRKLIGPHRARNRAALLVGAAFASAVAVCCWQLGRQPTLEEQLVGQPLSTAIELLGQPDSLESLDEQRYARWTRVEPIGYGVIVLALEDGDIISGVSYTSR
jgi:hypothetical protein